MMKYRYVTIVSLFSLFIATVCGSLGDLSPVFRRCLVACIGTKKHNISVFLKLLLWNVESECKYQCMREETYRRVAANQQVFQYYGHWPLKRIMGMQEFASVVFSVGNGLMHYLLLPIYRNCVPNRYYLKPFWIGYAYISMNIWFWSSVFHARDFLFTEKMDYFSASFGIFYSFYLSVLRMFNMTNRYLQSITGLCMMSLYALYVHYFATSPRFDYSLNMKICCTVSAAYILLWFIIALKERRRHFYKMIATFSLLMAAVSLEIFDFPPKLQIFDAHALWHAATIPLVYIWYSFIIDDGLYHSKRVSLESMQSKADLFGKCVDDNHNA